MKKIMFFFLVLSLGNCATALEGVVVSVADGDTITILDKNQIQHRVRIGQIDAPEKNQPWGQRAKQELISFVAGKAVRIDVSGKDRYGRLIGSVYVGTKNVGTRQLETGLAWVYDRYVTDATLYDVQRAAQAKQIGIWSDRDPIAPWVWRKSGVSRTSK